MLAIKTITTYFLSRESMDMRKLHKLCYYSQVWSLKEEGHEIFEEPVEAWLEGPSIEAVYHLYASFGRNVIPMEPTPTNLTEAQKRILEAVLSWYGHYSSDELIWLSKHEIPWLETRGDLEVWEGSRKNIPLDLMSQTKLVDRDLILSTRCEPPVSFGFKLWDFNLKNNEDALNRGDWFQEILEAMGEITGKSKTELEQMGIISASDQRKDLLESIGFDFNKRYKIQYDIRELMLKNRACSLFGVFINSVFHIVWFVSKKYRGPIVNIDERVNMALKTERTRKDAQKLFELEREKKDLEARNRELWDLLDEMTDPKIKKYKQ